MPTWIAWPAGDARGHTVRGDLGDEVVTVSPTNFEALAELCAHVPTVRVGRAPLEAVATAVEHAFHGG